MGKYGAGASMRYVIERETEEAEEILGRSGLDAEDREKLIGILKEMAYQWCSANAAARATEEAFLQMQGVRSEEECMGLIMKLPEYWQRSGIYETVMRETWPFD